MQTRWYLNPVNEDVYDLQRFVDAQEPVYESVLQELKRGRKTSHWMWFIFPQIAGLGRSAMAQKYAISSVGEAQAYLAHSDLGSRLTECVQLLLQTDGLSAEEILGAVDAIKLKSCLTLFFAASGGEQVFEDALDRFFDSVPDLNTLTAIRS